MKLFAAIGLSFLLLVAGASLAYAAKAIPELKAEADSASAAANAAPNDYSANWQAAKACQKYGAEMVKQESTGWKDLAKAAAKDGMKFGDAATKINPKGVEGWYWYGQSVGTYSDCVSILTALGEGLKGKTQKAFETAYSLDKSYDDGNPAVTLGRFWQVLPGIAGRDLKKAEELLSEYISNYGNGPNPNEDAWYFRGALYKEKGKLAEAKADLQKAASMGQEKAAKLLAEMK